MEPEDCELYAQYLDKEMTIMGLLSAFSVGLAALAVERFASAERGLLEQVWRNASPHVLAASAAGGVAGLLFYRQRSLLAYYYGQIALAKARGVNSPVSLEQWLTDADGWDTWIPYQQGFVALTLCVWFYASAIAASALRSAWPRSTIVVFVIPTLVAFLAAAFFAHVRSKYCQEEAPARTWWSHVLGRKAP